MLKNRMSVTLFAILLLTCFFGVMGNAAFTGSPGTLPMTDIAKRGRFLGLVPPAKQLNIILVLRSQHESEIQRAIALQNEPRPWAYHRWLTPDGYGRYFGADMSQLARTLQTLRSRHIGISYLSRSRRFIIVSGSTAAIESLFSVSLEYRTDGHAVYRANRYAPRIPASIPGVAAVIGLDTYYRVHSLAAEPTLRLRPHPFATVTPGVFGFGPHDLYEMYDFGTLGTSTDDGAGYSVAIQVVRQPLGSDVQNFSTYFKIKNPTLTQRYLTGMCEQPCPVPTPTNFLDDKESAMDVQWAHSAAPGASLYTVSVGDDLAASQLVGFTYIADVLANSVQFVGTSYGNCETLSDPYLLYSEQAAVDQGILEGQTWSAASGDSGADGCYPNDDPNLPTGSSTIFFPASLPNVIAGGGTSSTPQPTLGNLTGYNPESAWNENPCGGASSGGFSRIFPKPSWQSGVTFADGDRDVPDVAVHADLYWPGKNCAVLAGYWVLFENVWIQEAGTSVVPHIWNGLLADIAQKDGHAFGNVLPALYKLKNSAAFHQITLGNNTFGGITGFNAGAGYNRVTGLGPPDASQLAFVPRTIDKRRMLR